MWYLEYNSMNKMIFLNRTILIIIILFANLGMICQNDPTAAFRSNTLGNFEPEPYATINHLSQDFGENDNPLYPRSYLYQNPLQERKTVVRTLWTKDNHHLSDSINLSYWKKKEIGWSIVVELFDSDVSNIQHSSVVNYQLPYAVQQCLGASYTELQSERGEEVVELGYLSTDILDVLDQLQTKNNVVIDEQGIIQKGDPYYPEEFSTETLSQVIINGLRNQQINGYSSSKFREIISPLDALASMRKAKSQLTGYRIIEDYYINPLTYKLTSKVMGIGVIGKSSEMGDELLWIRFPELRIAMEPYASRVNDTLYNMEYIFDSHINTSVVDTIINSGYDEYGSNDFIYQVSLEPLVKLALWHENTRTLSISKKLEKEDGINTAIYFNDEKQPDQYQDYYPNKVLATSGNMPKGYCEGTWKYYFPSGKIKAERNFIAGVLEGEQVNYYENGDIYARYHTENGNLLDLERYNKDGSLMEKGNFVHGVVNGNWEYHLPCSPKQKDRLTNYHILGKAFHSTYDGKNINFGVHYKQMSSSDCPMYLERKKSTKFCLWSDYN